MSGPSVMRLSGTRSREDPRPLTPCRSCPMSAHIAESTPASARRGSPDRYRSAGSRLQRTYLNVRPAPFRGIMIREAVKNPLNALWVKSLCLKTALNTVIAFNALFHSGTTTAVPQIHRPTNTDPRIIPARQNSLHSPSQEVYGIISSLFGLFIVAAEFESALVPAPQDEAKYMENSVWADAEAPTSQQRGRTSTAIPVRILMLCIYFGGHVGFKYMVDESRRSPIIVNQVCGPLI
ncbi:hypothetical protein C8R45DRAFT_106386 [Mycena sanguinolenta]|nr:hypothetical protein C8R45DRAFT_106386 [Mycena sanguinolenta]